MHNIQKVSQWFQWLFIAIFFFLPIMHIIGWIFLPLRSAVVIKGAAFLISLIPDGIKILHPVTSADRFLGFIIGLIPLFFTEFILFQLIKLFGAYKLNEIFSLENVKRIRLIGYFMLLGQAVNPFYQALMSFALTWRNPTGTKSIEMGFGNVNIALIFTAFIIILISWIMAEAYKLSEEQKYTI